jgi:hypothetical protein
MPILPMLTGTHTQKLELVIHSTGDTGPFAPHSIYEPLSVTSRRSATALFVSEVWPGAAIRRGCSKQNMPRAGESVGAEASFPWWESR